MISREKVKAKIWSDVAPYVLHHVRCETDSKYLHRKAVLKLADEIFDSRGTCGECEHWNRRYKKENICFVHDIMKKPSGYCDDFERKED